MHTFCHNCIESERGRGYCFISHLGSTSHILQHSFFELFRTPKSCLFYYYYHSLFYFFAVVGPSSFFVSTPPSPQILFDQMLFFFYSILFSFFFLVFFVFHNTVNLKSRHRKCPACGGPFGQGDIRDIFFNS